MADCQHCERLTAVLWAVACLLDDHEKDSLRALPFAVAHARRLAVDALIEHGARAGETWAAIETRWRVLAALRGQPPMTPRQVAEWRAQRKEKTK